MNGKLSEKAMLVSLRLHAPSWQRKDRQITNEVHSNHNTSNDAGQYNKSLLPKNALTKIQSADSALRLFHAQNTLPWFSDGTRILPTENFMSYHHGVSDLKQTRENAVQEFVANYPSFVEQAKVRLNGMFNQNDYPDISSIPASYGISLDYLPFPDSADFRVDLADSDLQTLQDQIEERIKEVSETALKDLWERLASVIGHIVEKLIVPAGSPGGSFHDSLIENLRDLVNLLPRLNVTNNAELEDIRLEISTQLIAIDAQVLRDDIDSRKKVMSAAQIILEKINLRK